MIRPWENRKVMSEPKKKSSLKNRLTGRSIPEVERAALELVARFGSSRTVELNGRKFSMEALLNGAVLYILSLPEKEQERVLTAGVRKYEALMSGEEIPQGHAGESQPARGPVDLMDEVKVTRYSSRSAEAKSRKNQGA